MEAQTTSAKAPKSRRGLPRQAAASFAASDAPPAAGTVPPLTEEEAIESAKYLPRDLPPRAFEEERFLFPETYGVTRVRLLVKDPEWLFAHWDLDPRSLDALRTDLGDRAMALSPLTLRITDPGNGGTSVILLPEGARSWYVRADSARRSYRAELGVTLPSGEFRCLAESNVVTAPRVGPSSERSTRVMTYNQAREIPQEAVVAASLDETRTDASDPGPWNVAPQAGVLADGAAHPAGGTTTGGASEAPERGGASDVFRR